MPRKKEPRGARALARSAGRGRYDRQQATGDRHDEQRARLLSAAAEVFATKGFADASVEDVVVIAGMSRRTFYEHFDDLRDTLMQVHEMAASMTFRAVEERVRATSDPVEKLRAGVIAFLEMLSQHGPLARVVFREVRAAGREFEVRREATIARFVGLLFEGVAEAHAAGVASRAPDELTLYALVSAMEAVGMRYVERREESRAMEAAPALIELVIRAFR
ncbi:MAG: TetR/AcrR family transcriptional regulator [Polyangiaceae bacterium]